MEIAASSLVGEEDSGFIYIRHEDLDELKFNFSTYKRLQLINNDVFTHINKFWKTKPLSFQKAVYDLYVRANDCFFRINDKDYLAAELKKVMTDLYKLHPFQEMRDWLVFNSGITIPEIDEEYKPDTDRDYTPEKTYIRKEYVDLLTVVFMLRLAFPIWSYYIRIVKDNAGTGLKEHRAFQLLEKTELFDAPPIRKMVAYITANNKKSVIRSGAIGLLSTEDHPYWIMTQFCVRKLATVELQFRAPNATLVSLLFSFIRSANTEGNFQDRYKDKGSKENGESGEGDGTNKISVYERHRNSTGLSVEEAAEFETALKGVEDTRAKFFPYLDPKALERSVLSARELLKPENFAFTALPCQRTLLGWILSRQMSHVGIDYQKPQTVIQYLPLAEAVLWARGHKYLALLMTSRIPQDTSVHLVSSPPFRSRLSDANLAKIREHFPHVRMVQSRKADPREECFVINDIDALSSEISEKPWVMTADESLIVDFQRSPSRLLKPIPDIRNELAALAVSIADQSFYNF